MVGAVEGDEGLGVPGRLEDLAGLVDADDLVDGGVQDQQRAPEPDDPLPLRLLGQVVGEVLADVERPAADLHLQVPVVGGHAVAEQVVEVGRAGGGAEHGDRRDRGEALGHGDRGGAAEGVADQQVRAAVVVGEPARRGLQVTEVAGEGGLGEVAPRGAEAREVEAEHRDAVLGQGGGDPGRGVRLPAAGEAVREQGRGPRRTGREVEGPDQLVARRPGEAHVLVGRSLGDVSTDVVAMGSSWWYGGQPASAVGIVRRSRRAAPRCALTSASAGRG